MGRMVLRQRRLLRIFGVHYVSSVVVRLVTIDFRQDARRRVLVFTGPSQRPVVAHNRAAQVHGMRVIGVAAAQQASCVRASVRVFVWFLRAKRQKERTE